MVVTHELIQVNRFLVILCLLRMLMLGTLLMGDLQGMNVLVKVD